MVIEECEGMLEIGGVDVWSVNGKGWRNGIDETVKGVRRVVSFPSSRSRSAFAN